jgi:hypothetical protein
MSALTKLRAKGNDSKPAAPPKHLGFGSNTARGWIIDLRPGPGDYSPTNPVFNATMVKIGTQARFPSEPVTLGPGHYQPKEFNQIRPLVPKIVRPFGTTNERWRPPKKHRPRAKAESRSARYAERDDAADDTASVGSSAIGPGCYELRLPSGTCEPGALPSVFRSVTIRETFRAPSKTPGPGYYNVPRDGSLAWHASDSTRRSSAFHSGPAASRALFTDCGTSRLENVGPGVYENLHRTMGHDTLVCQVIQINIMRTCMCIFIFIFIFIYLFIYIYLYLFIYLFIYLFVYIFIYITFVCP